LCDECRAHHAAVLAGLATLGVPYRENPRLVRGLDYYTRTAFEVHEASLGAQSALGGGGRYDGLFEACGGPPTPAVGFSSGIERILVALAARAALPDAAAVPERIQVLPLGDAARRQALLLAHDLRRLAPTEVVLTGKPLKSLLQAANRAGTRVTILLGEAEMQRGEALVKDMQSGEQAAHAWAAVAEAAARLLRAPSRGAHA
jgi:histidyl-tRNA synthetase